MINKKNSNFKIILTIFFILIVGFVLYFFTIQKNSDNSVLISEATSSAGWNTYTNNDLGFKIDHESNLKPTLTHPIQGNDFYGKIIGNISFNPVTSDGEVEMWEIGVTIIEPNKSISEILAGYGKETVLEKKIMIDGIDAYEYGIPEEKGGPVYTHTVLVMNGGKLYEISVQAGEYNDQIINSFHFLK